MLALRRNPPICWETPILSRYSSTLPPSFVSSGGKRGCDKTPPFALHAAMCAVITGVRYFIGFPDRPIRSPSGWNRGSTFCRSSGFVGRMCIPLPKPRPTKRCSSRAPALHTTRPARLPAATDSPSWLRSYAPASHVSTAASRAISERGR